MILVLSHLAHPPKHSDRLAVACAFLQIPTPDLRHQFGGHWWQSFSQGDFHDFSSLCL